MRSIGEHDADHEQQRRTAVSVASLIPDWALRLLACPKCGSELAIHEHGLICLNSHKYPVTNGIPRFVEDDRYASNFALEWRRNARTQYDSAESTESAETFVAKTGLTEGDLRGKIVLDYGCGSGRFSEVATRNGARVVGLDISSAVDVAAENLRDRPFVGVQGDALSPPFRADAFDVVFSIGVLHHTPDCRRGVKCAARLVRLGGVIALWLYWKGIRITPVTNIYRLITTRLPAQAFYAFCEKWVPRIYRAQRLPLIGWILRIAIPVSGHQKAAWRVLDTFDWYSPKFQSKHDYGQVEGWLTAEGIEKVERLGVPVAVRGTRVRVP